MYDPGGRWSGRYVLKMGQFCAFYVAVENDRILEVMLSGMLIF